MAYLPPNGATVALQINSGYLPPAGDAVELNSLSVAFYLSITAATDDALADFSLHHIPLYHLIIAATTDDAVGEFALEHIPLYHLSIAATTDDAVADFALRFSPRASITIVAVTDDAVFSMAAYHDWSGVVSSRPDFSALYRAYLAKTGEETIELPMSSWQASLNFGERNSYVSAIIPGVTLHGDLIAARAGGTLTIKKGYRNGVTGEEQLEDLFSIALTSIRLDQGGTNESCSLEGLATLEWPPAKTVALSGITYRRTDADGSLNLRGSVDLRVRPGDTVTYDGASFTVGRLSIQVSPTGESMEITEAE